MHLCKFLEIDATTSADQYHRHNAGALTIVKAVHEQLPKATNIAFFDSAFHSTVCLKSQEGQELILT